MTLPQHQQSVALAAIGIIILLLAACGMADNSDSDLQVDSGVSGMAFDAMRDKYQRLANEDSWVTIKTYGKSVRGQELFALEIKNPSLSASNRRPALLVTEATHGNEYLGLGERLPEWFLAQRQSADLASFFSRGGTILMIPVYNPDGYEFHRNLTPAQRLVFHNKWDRGNTLGRANANRVDLNRDFPVISSQQNIANASQVETKATIAYLESKESAGYDLKATLDYHCCLRNAGTILFPYGTAQAGTLTTEEAQRYEAVSKLFTEALPGLAAGALNKLISYPMSGLSTDFYHDRFKSLSFTFEGRTQRREEVSRLEQHGTALARLAQQVSINYSTLAEGAAQLTLAVYEGPGQELKLAGSYAGQADNAKLCKGTEVDCDGASDRWIDLSSHEWKNQRSFLFRTQPFPEPLQPDTTYTFYVRNSNNEVIAKRSFKIIRN